MSPNTSELWDDKNWTVLRLPVETKPDLISWDLRPTCWLTAGLDWHRFLYETCLCSCFFGWHWPVSLCVVTWTLICLPPWNKPQRAGGGAYKWHNHWPRHQTYGQMKQETEGEKWHEKHFVCLQRGSSAGSRGPWNFRGLRGSIRWDLICLQRGSSVRSRGTLELQGPQRLHQMGFSLSPERFFSRVQRALDLQGPQRLHQMGFSLSIF